MNLRYQDKNKLRKRGILLERQVERIFSCCYVTSFCLGQKHYEMSEG